MYYRVNKVHIIKTLFRMENKRIFRPLPPKEPELLRLRTYTFANFYPVDFFFISLFAFIYFPYMGCKFDSFGFCIGAICLYLIIRIWPYVVTNSQIRINNKKMKISYEKEVIKYNKELKEYLEYDKERFRLTGKNDFFDSVDISYSRLERLKSDQEFFKIERGKHIETSHNYKINTLEIEVNNIISKYSGICAVLAIQPIPFADIFILTPTQILMGKEIASLRGYEIKENSIEIILKEISGIIGLGVIAQQLVIGAYKTFLPFLGGITTIPVVYGLTYGIGKTMDYYIVAKINGRQINKSEIEKIFNSSRQIGEREGKSKEKELYTKSRVKDSK